MNSGLKVFFGTGGSILLFGTILIICLKLGVFDFIPKKIPIEGT